MQKTWLWILGAAAVLYFFMSKKSAATANVGYTTAKASTGLGSVYTLMNNALINLGAASGLNPGSGSYVNSSDDTSGTSGSGLLMGPPLAPTVNPTPVSFSGSSSDFADDGSAGTSYSDYISSSGDVLPSGE